MKEKILIIALMFILVGDACIAQQPKLDSLFASFKQSSFGRVNTAKRVLENCQKEIITHLIDLLEDTSFVKLTGTADLIYPGAAKFYGHGPIINYDIDWISVRAGWLLEDLTFMDFGYQISGVNDSTLFLLMTKYYGDNRQDIGIESLWNRPKREKLIEFRKMLA